MLNPVLSEKNCIFEGSEEHVSCFPEMNLYQSCKDFAGASLKNIYNELNLQ